MTKLMKTTLLAAMALSTITATTLTGGQSAQAQNLFGQVQKTMNANVERANNAGKHVRWCRKQYRSYRQYDDSYTNYFRKRVRCQSPYKF